jgi:hypothetical protein
MADLPPLPELRIATNRASVHYYNDESEVEPLFGRWQAGAATFRRPLTAQLPRCVAFRRKSLYPTDSRRSDLAAGTGLHALSGRSLMSPRFRARRWKDGVSQTFISRRVTTPWTHSGRQAPVRR